MRSTNLSKEKKSVEKTLDRGRGQAWINHVLAQALAVVGAVRLPRSKAREWWVRGLVERNPLG